MPSNPARALTVLALAGLAAPIALIAIGAAPVLLTRRRRRIGPPGTEVAKAGE